MSCSKKILARRDKFGCVYECSCGTIHISFGAVDMKFTREGLLETYAMLAEAIRQLKSRSPQGSLESSPETDEAIRLLVGSSHGHIN